jgi:subtilisin family serine protease
MRSLGKMPTRRPTRPGLHSREIGMIACFGLLTMVAAACDRSPAAPLLSKNGQISQNVVHSADQPFYFYEGSKIYLTADSDQLVVQSSDAKALDRAQSASLSIGMSLTDGGLLQQAPGHRLLRLPQGTSLAMLTRLRALIQADPAYTFVSPVYHTEDGHALIQPVNRLAVQFRDDVNTSQIDALVRQLGAQIIRPPRPDSGWFYYVLSYPRDSIDAFRVAAQLDANQLVKWADPDKITEKRGTSVPSDAYFPLQNYLASSNVLNSVTVDLDVERAWDLSIGTGIKMGIADDGFDFTNPDYVSVFGGANGIDEMTGFAGSDGVFTPYCNDEHGTAVLGIVGSGHNNGGIAGIAPGVILEGARILRRNYPCPSDLGGPQAASDVQVADALNFLWSNAHADVMSNSWIMLSVSNAVTNAITNAVTMGRHGLGTPVFFAAGNFDESLRYSGSPHVTDYPASLANVMAVSAIDRFGNIAAYAPRGKIDVVAVTGAHTDDCASGDIVTTDIFGSGGCNDGPSGDVNYTSTFSGTSAATPQVAAIAALILARYPNLTATQVYARIKNGAVPWGRSDDYGAGKVSAYNAVF